MLIAAFGLFLAACNQSSKTKTKTANADQTEVAKPVKVSVDSFLTVAENYLGKELIVYGTVDHVCKHGGKRLKMFGNNPQHTIHAEAAEALGQFNAELEGSDICVTGIVAENQMDSAYIAEYEANIKKAMNEADASDTEMDEPDMEHKKGVDHHATLEKIENWKQEIKTNGKGYISTYYLEASEYHKKK